MYKILITGATGSLGNIIIKNLNGQLASDDEIICLVRASSQSEARGRFNKIFGDIEFSCKIKVIVADLTNYKCGMGDANYIKLSKEITHILHAAASTRFNLTLKDARLNNVLTTKQILDFAINCNNLERFAHVSTAFVAGKRSGVISEDELDHNKGFLNTYEQSKYEAEKLVIKYKTQLPSIILRPSLIQTKKNVHTIDQPQNAITIVQNLIMQDKLPVLPGKKDDKIDIISSDKAAKLIICLLLKKELNTQSFHITQCAEAPTVQTIIGDKAIEKNILFCGNIDNYKLQRDIVLNRRPELVKIYEKIEIFLLELAYPKVFDNKQMKKNCKKII
jgi:long-chain acyl-CoA synthetase